MEMETLKVNEYINMRRFLNIEIRENLRWLHTFPPLRDREYIHELDSYIVSMIAVCDAVIECSRQWRNGNTLGARQAQEEARRCAERFLNLSFAAPSTPPSYDVHISRISRDFAFIRWVRVANPLVYYI